MPIAGHVKRGPIERVIEVVYGAICSVRIRWADDRLRKIDDRCAKLLGVRVALALAEHIELGFAKGIELVEFPLP